MRIDGGKNVMWAEQAMNPSTCDQQSSPSPGFCETSPPQSTPRVLIVDDEADVVQALKVRLETAGCRALTAADGAEALALLGHSSVDLILTDLMMPNLDGLELTRRIRQDPNRPAVPVLLFSCNDDPTTRDLALEFGARDYLSKTLGTREIVSRIQEILMASKPRASLPEGPRSSYGSAEANLSSQLRAISNLSANPTPTKTNGAPGLEPAGGAWTGDDLIKLAASLDRYVEAQRIPRDD